MRILKVRWWIPVCGVVLAAAILGFVVHKAYQVPKLERLSGAAPTVPPPPPPPPPASAAAIAVPGIQGFIGGLPSGVAGGVVGGVLGGVPPRFMSPSVIPMMTDRLPDTEEYSKSAESGFTDAAADRLSTFAADVDTASYSNVRRFLLKGERPPKNAVRLEEMLNYFLYSYPEPSGAEPLSVTTEVAACPWAHGHKLLRIGLRTRRIDTQSLPPSHLTFLLDVSGSMEDPVKLPLVKKSLALLVEQLRPQDTAAIAVYAGSAGLVLGPTPGWQKTILMDAIERLEAGGSTAGGEGLRLAYTTAREMFRPGTNNRVILATDGDFNVGSSSDQEMVRLIEDERRHGVYLTVLGFGMGNLKDSKLEKLADHGNGHYAYVDSLMEARKVFVEEFGATLQTVAKDVKLQVEFNPARVRSYRLLGYDNRRLTAEEFRDDAKDAGDLGAGHSVTALYEVVPATEGSLPEDAFTLRIRHKPPEQEVAVEAVYPGRGEASTPSADFRFAAAVAQFGMLLADSKYRGQASYESAAALAASALTPGDERRTDFVELVKKASALRD